MVEIRVSNQAQLDAALATATGGETIVLEGGTYGHLQLVHYHSENIDFSKGLTFVASDPADPPVISSMNLLEAHNVTFDGLVFDYTHNFGDTTDYLAVSNTDFNIRDSQNVTIKNSAFQGDTIAAFGSDTFAVGTGLKVFFSDGLRIEDTEFDGFYRGLAVDGSDGVVITGNDIHSMSADGMGFTAMSNLTISDNYIHDFDIPEDNGGHLDFIQFWVQREDGASSDVLITNNVLDSGDGHFTQSIFMRSEMADAGGGPGTHYQNITITQNIIYNGHRHGITLGQADGVNISNNTLLYNDNDQSNLDARTASPQISVNEVSTGVSIANNISAGVSTAQDGWTVSGNVDVQRAEPSQDNYYGDLFVNALADGDATLTDLRLMPHGSAAIGTDVGAALTHIENWTDLTHDAVIFDLAGDGLHSKTVDFGINHILGQDTVVDVEWTIGDNETVLGDKLTYTFADAGTYTVQARVTYDDGTSEIYNRTVEVTSPVVAAYAEAASGSEPVHLISQSARLMGMAELTLAFTANFTGIMADTSETVVHLQSGVKVISRNDALVFIVRTQDDIYQLTLEDPALLNGADHDIIFKYSSVSGTASVILDGQEVVTASGFDGQLLQGSGSAFVGDAAGNSFPGGVDKVLILDSVSSVEDTLAFINQEITILCANPPETPPEPKTEEQTAPDAPDSAAEPQTVSLEGRALGLATQGQTIDLAQGQVSLRSDDLFPETSGFTLAFDFKNAADDDGSFGRMFEFNTFGVVKSTQGLALWYKINGSTYWLTTEELDLNTEAWRSLAITFDPETGVLKLFLDGVVVASDTGLVSSPLHSDGGLLHFRGASADNAFQGQIADIVFAAEALDNAEIASLAAQTVSGATFEDQTAVTLLQSDTGEAPAQMSNALEIEGRMVFLDTLFEAHTGGTQSYELTPGSDASADAPADADADATAIGDFTVSLDFTNGSDVGADAYRLLSIQDGIIIAHAGNAVQFMLYTENGIETVHARNLPISDQSTHNITVTYSSLDQVFSFYLDGQITHVQTQVSGSLELTDEIVLNLDASAAYDGVIEDVFITDESLGAETVAWLAEADLSADSFVEGSGLGGEFDFV